MSAPEKLLTAEQIAELLAVRKAWVYNAVQREGLPGYRLGHYLRFREAEVLEWLERQRENGEAGR